MATATATATAKKRYALVGTGGRAMFYYTAIARDFAATAEMVAFCDTNKTRMAYANARLQSLGHAAVPAYVAADFDRMIRDTRPDEVIVTTVDRTHDRYIVRALEQGCGVVTEKPMAIDAPRCAAVLAAAAATGGRVRVTFNYRYAPHNTRVFSLLRAGAIGTVTSVHFEWMLDTAHGGGDALLLHDLFGEPASDEHMRAASHVDGALSVLTGIAANKSVATGQVVHVDDVLRIP